MSIQPIKKRGRKPKKKLIHLFLKLKIKYITLEKILNPKVIQKMNLY